MKRIVIITGVPGTGKTTVSKIIAQKTNSRHIDLTSLSLKKNLILGEDAYRETKIVDMEALVQRVLEIIKKTERSLVIEGHYAHDIVDSKYLDLVFVLRRAPWKLYEELESRDYPAEKVKENVEAEILGICLLEALESQKNKKVCEIDTTDQSPNETAEEILSIMKGDLPCLRGKIDWTSHQNTIKILEEINACI